MNSFYFDLKRHIHVSLVKQKKTNKYTLTLSMSLLDYLASAFWKVVLHLQDEACRTDAPC